MPPLNRVLSILERTAERFPDKGLSFYDKFHVEEPARVSYLELLQTARVSPMKDVAHLLYCIIFS